MTKPRTAVDRELYGILGDVPKANLIQKEWNAYFRDHNMDAFMDRYPTTVETLPERLSEMFHFDRRLYIVAESLQDNIIPLLDEVEGEGSVNMIMNEEGKLVGKWVENFDPQGTLGT